MMDGACGDCAGRPLWAEVTQINPALLVRIPGDTEDLAVAWRAGAWIPKVGDTVELVRIGGAWGVRDRWLRAAPAPDAPEIVAAIPGVGEITVRWAQPAASSPVDGFVIYFRVFDAGTPFYVATRVYGAEQTQGTIANLTPGTFYEVRVAAFNEDTGESEPSAIRATSPT